MARNEITVDADPDAVWRVLSDAGAYGHWVVGSKDIRAVEGAFPAPGSRFHHRVGVGPLTLSDHTEVIESQPARHLRLRAKARPLGTATVDLTLTPDGAGRTRIRMIEDAGDRLTRLVFNPLTHRLVQLRNAESLRRLARLAERA